MVQEMKELDQLEGLQGLTLEGPEDVLVVSEPQGAEMKR